VKNRILVISLMVVLALSAGLIGCGAEEEPTISEYNLTISSTEGGAVTTPGEGTGSLSYDEGEVVGLVGVAHEGYRFVSWTGDVGTIADVNDATTTITMNGDYSITANFEAIGHAQYNLTISSAVGGSVTTPGQGTFPYDAGTVVGLAAKADEGYRFVNWTGNVGSIANVNAASTTITVNGNYSITANFEELPEYDLTTSSTVGGSVTVPGEGTFTYYDDTAVNLVATSTSGYYFVNWTGDVGTIVNVNAPTTTITMNDDYSITANFERIPAGKFALAASSTAGGSVTVPGEGAFIYEVGKVVNLVASPASGYRFVNWTGNVGTIANVNAASTTITMNGDYSITANFIAQYDLTISSTAGGSVTTPGVGTHTYDKGTVVNLVASPASGYRFVNWTGNVGTIADVHDASTTITINGDYSITANFKEIPEYDLTISSTTGGSVTTPGEGAFTYDEGTVVNLVATPDTCCYFVNWTGDVGTIANINAASTTIIMNDNYSITANFEEEETVTFPDPNLEAAIRAAIGKPTGPICPSDLEGLTALGAYQKNITDLTGLDHCTSLTELDLRFNQISDISPLANLTNLTALTLWQNPLSDISPLAGLTKLWRLYLGSNQISDISPLANLTNLTILILWQNQLSDISPLANLTNLTFLDLQTNQISDISPLANLTNLTNLALTLNQISDISPLANLTNLTSLFLPNNQISDISPLANLTNLSYVFLSNNQVSDISPLVNLTNLTWISIGGNQISDISPLSGLTKLWRLYLGTNQISDISPLVENAGLSEGDSVSLEGNPLSSDSVNVYIPQLEARGVTVSY